VANFHRDMIENLVELLAAAGLSGLEELEPSHINRRVKGTEIRNYAELYPGVSNRCLLSDESVPEKWKKAWKLATADAWN
jgi:hypothetical protein